MHHGHVLKKLNFDLIIISPGSGGAVCRQNICYHAAAFRDRLLFDMQHDHVLKQLNFDLLTPTAGSGRDLRAKYVLPSSS